MDDQTQFQAESSDAQQQLNHRIRRLVLMKETGPKSAAWHRARVKLIWRLQDRLATGASSSNVAGISPHVAATTEPEQQG